MQNLSSKTGTQGTKDAILNDQVIIASQAHRIRALEAQVQSLLEENSLLELLLERNIQKDTQHAKT